MRKVIGAGLHNNTLLESLLEIYNEIGAQEQISIIGIYRNEKVIRLFGFHSWPVDPPSPSFRWFGRYEHPKITFLDSFSCNPDF